MGVNKATASYYFRRLRQLIYDHSEDKGLLVGEVEVDESYFGGRRKGKRGRGAAGKVPVLGLTKKGWQGLCDYDTRCQERYFTADHSGESDA